MGENEDRLSFLIAFILSFLSIPLFFVIIIVCLFFFFHYFASFRTNKIKEKGT